MSLRPLLLLVLPLAAACGPKRLGEEGRYQTGDPGDGWRRVSAGGADKAWFNAELAATLYTDSNCLSRFEDSTLPDLITHLTFGVAKGAPLRSEDRMVDGRAALVRAYEGSLDGVAVRIGALTTKRDQCTYDVLLIAAPRHFEAALGAFETVVAGFDVRGDG